MSLNLHGRPQERRPFWHFRHPALWISISILSAVAFGIWRITPGTATVEPVVANVKLSSNTVMLGRNLEIRIEGAPQLWWGELSLDATHKFPVQSNVFRLKATSEHGFLAGKSTELYLWLVDSRGHEIPVSNAGRFPISVIRPAVALNPEDRSVNADGASGSVDVSAAPGYQWSVAGVPEWMKIESGQRGAGNGVISYIVLKNETNEERSAVLAVGDGTFSIAQARSSTLQIPFRDKFAYLSAPPAVWTLRRPGKSTPDDSPIRWTWEQLGEKRPTLTIAKESPTDGNSLLIQSAAADEREWATLLYLPHVNLQLGSEYPSTVWMKAENPVDVAVAISQDSPPWEVCGERQVVRVSAAWNKYDLPLKIMRPDCEAANNRLVFALGHTRGKLWIADLSIGDSR